MGCTQVPQEDKIHDMYPEIRKYSISPSLSFDEAGNACTIPIVRPLKMSYVMQSKNSKNNAEASSQCLGLQIEAGCDTDTASTLKQYRSFYPISLIAGGLCENLKNIQQHRVIMFKEISRALSKCMIVINDNTMMPMKKTGTRKEE